MKKTAKKKAPARKRAAPKNANAPEQPVVTITGQDRREIAVIVAEIFKAEGMVMSGRATQTIRAPQAGDAARPKPSLMEHLDTMEAQKERLGGIVLRLEMLADKACGAQPNGDEGSAGRTQAAGARGVLEAVQIGHGILIERLDSALMRLEGFL